MQVVVGVVVYVRLRHGRVRLKHYRRKMMMMMMGVVRIFHQRTSGGQVLRINTVAISTAAAIAVTCVKLRR